ncbi:MAG: NADH-quinone oxidoreductase subunit N [Planctomycetota bacterium]|nr:MAG: NADH-quinone oxidoreductase subunit N [Planctomycetota bacterium]
MPLSYGEALQYLLPEVAVTLGLCVVLCWEIFVKGRRAWDASVLSIGFLAVAAVLLVQRLDYAPATVFGMVTVDRFATVFKLFITSATVIVLLFDLQDRRALQDGRGETCFLLLTAVLGSYFLVGTTHLLLLYLGLETLGLSSYVLAGMHKRSRASAEAALKYVVYGALASGILLFGASLLYGMTGTLDLRLMAVPIEQAIREGRTAQIALPTLLILVGFGFKLSLVPFQWWAPDVYQGVTTPIATFLAVGSKGVAMAAFLRYLSSAYATVLVQPGQEPSPYLASLGGTLALVSAATMIFGNLAALRQDNLKRLLAYSSIAHAGYILMGVALLSEDGFNAATLYTFVYYFMNLGAFGMVIYFANQTGREDIQSLQGLGARHPVAGVSTVVFLASLTGLPPTAGFAGKWLLIKVAWEGGLHWLALLTALLSVVSLFYYFRIAKALFLTEPARDVPPVRSPALSGLLGLLALASIAFLHFDPLLQVAEQGVRVLFWG